MTTTGTLKSLARLGYVRSIADQYEDQTADIPDVLRGLLGSLRTRCDAAMQCWPGMLDHGDVRRIGNMLISMGQSTPLDKPNDIISYTSFGLCLLEDLTQFKLHHDKRKAVDLVGKALLDIHHFFAENGGEEYLSLKAGSDGAAAWEQARM